MGKTWPETFLAALHLRIDPPYELDEDAVAEGLLGGKYVKLDVGGAEDMIPAGGEITQTQSAVNLESLLGKAFYRASSGGGAQ